MASLKDDVDFVSQAEFPETLAKQDLVQNQELMGRALAMHLNWGLVRLKTQACTFVKSILKVLKIDSKSLSGVSLAGH